MNIGTKFARVRKPPKIRNKTSKNRNKPHKDRYKTSKNRNKPPKNRYNTSKNRNKPLRIGTKPLRIETNL